MEKEVLQGPLLCVCQDVDDGILCISFHYGLEGMGQSVPYTVRTPAIGTVSDTFEDIKVKLAKAVTKVEKRHRKLMRKKAEEKGESLLDPNNDNTASNTDMCHLNDIKINIPETHSSLSNSKELNENSPNVSNTKSEKNNINIEIKRNGKVFDYDTENSDAWKTNNILTIKICDITVHYVIHYNPPIVKQFELSKHIFVGYMLYPRGNFLNCDRSNCKFEWFRSKSKPKPILNTAYKRLFLPEACLEKENGMNHDHGCDADKEDDIKEQHQQIDIVKRYQESPSWVFIGSGFNYTPQNEDVGCYIKVVCKPKSGVRHNIEFTSEASCVVRNGPANCPYEKRQEHTKERASKGRIVDYNILADKYANTKQSIDLYYPYCAPFALGLDYRINLIMKEILGYKADIMCLQEVDQKVFYKILYPILEMNGYYGYMKTKCKTLSQGPSIFYKRDKFRLIDIHDKEVRSALAGEKIHSELKEKISQNVTFKSAVLERPTLLLVAVLESLENPNKLILVANTHLTCGQKIAHIRAVQMAVELEHIEDIISTCYSDRDISVVICGDLNSLPESAVVQMLSNGRVTAKHADWFIGGRPEYVGNMDLTTTLQLESAYKDLKYTNYVSGFYGVIDYIYHDKKNFEVISTVPLPQHEEILENTACPSIKIPSDHLALVCDLKWK